jgi:hypothetical protein
MTDEQPLSAAAGEPTPGRKLLEWRMTRRQFVVIAGGGVAAIAVAGAYDLSTMDSTPGKSPFWMVRVVRAGRGGRLTASGQRAFHAAPGPSVFTSQLSPHAVSRPAGSSSSHADGHTGGGSDLATSYPQPQNLTWGDVVVLEVEVVNIAAVSMLFSPGQLRLKLANGQTITPEDASCSPEPIAAGTVEMMWISYLAPSDAAEFSVEFTDPQHDALLALGVPLLVTAKEQS